MKLHKDIFRPIGKGFLFSPSAIVGSDKCIEYGLKIVSKNRVEKEQQLDLNSSESDVNALTAEINAANSRVDRISKSNIYFINPVIAKELQMNVVYSAGMYGWNKEQWASNIKEVGSASFSVRFYLEENKQTGKVRAVIVKNNNK